MIFCSLLSSVCCSTLWKKCYIIYLCTFITPLSTLTKVMDWNLHSNLLQERLRSCCRGTVPCSCRWRTGWWTLNLVLLIWLLTSSPGPPSSLTIFPTFEKMSVSVMLDPCRWSGSFCLLLVAGCLCYHFVLWLDVFFPHTLVRSQSTNLSSKTFIFYCKFKSGLSLLLKNGLHLVVCFLYFN